MVDNITDTLHYYEKLDNMKKKIDLEKLWEELESITNIDERVILIHRDIIDNEKRYKVLAEKNPYRLFELLGGDESKISTRSWAYEFTYDDYIELMDLEYDSKEEKKWNLNEKSIERAHDTGNWLVTGTCLIEGPNDIILKFEFEFCEGYVHGIIGTPYNVEKHGNYGIKFG